MIGSVGAKTIGGINNMGRFGRFVWQSAIASFRICTSPRAYALIWTQMHIIGVRSVPVVMITGAFVGMTFAGQAYDPLAGMGFEGRLGVLFHVSCV
ncbi:MAG: ABC transporter permease [Planctomycetes bacterium]|nr:ABC transporter permease [Planctomycetota bacterium]